MKTFVTGATGFVGSHVARALAARGDVVLALARRPDQHAALRELGATPVNGSLENERSLVAALEGVEVVYHSAGLVAAKDEAEFFAVNDAGTRRLLDAVRRAAPDIKRFVYVSSQAALGPSPRGAALAEDAECRPVTAYGRSKLAGELTVRGAHLPWSVVRPSIVYGPRDREFLRLFKIVRRGIAPVIGTGRQQLSLIYVEDLVRVLLLAGTRTEALGQILHAAHPETVLSRDIVRAAGQAVGRSPFIIPVPGFLAAPVVWAVSRVGRLKGRRSALNVDKLPELLAPAFIVSVAKAERLLGWKAEHDVVGGMALTAEWYKKEGWLD
ncbi:MAG: NAD-dependent epimerase/dehydratase family protein [Gemmatimonadales bacterium]